MLVTSKEDDVTPELLNALYDTGRPNLVAMATTEFGEDYSNSSDGALLAFDMEHRARHVAYAADVLPVEDVEDLGGDATDAGRYGIARGDDPLDEVDIGGMDETTRPTFISQHLAPKVRASFISLLSTFRD
ncbi:hypothetical protein Droror1_Dr00027368 [Drosera rotundifolia]